MIHQVVIGCWDGRSGLFFSLRLLLKRQLLQMVAELRIVLVVRRLRLLGRNVLGRRAVLMDRLWLTVCAVRAFVAGRFLRPGDGRVI